jgi:hypothetical protein
MAGTQGGLGLMVNELWLYGEKAGERGPAKQRGWEQTRGCLALLERRWSSPRQWTRQKLNGGHGTTVDHSEAPWVRAVRERESEGVRLRAQLSEGSE